MLGDGAVGVVETVGLIDEAGSVEGQATIVFFSDSPDGALGWQLGSVELTIAVTLY